MNSKQRLNLILEQTGLTKAELSKKIGFSESAIGKYCSEDYPKNKPGGKFALLLEKYLGVNSKWLLEGEGNMMLEHAKPSEETWLDLPVMDVRCAAGAGAINYEEKQVGTISLPKSVIGSNHNKHIVKVSGESMHPTLKDEDMVIVDLSETEIIDGKIYVICVQSGCIIKRLRRVAAGIEIYSDNPTFTLETTKADQIKIVGRVVNSICRF